MRRLARIAPPLGALLLPLLAHAVPARASGDFMCLPSWSLVHPDYSDCDNMAMLQPGNDTRVNLMLLMLESRGGKLDPAQMSPERPGGDDPMNDWPTFSDRFSAPRPEGEETSNAYAEGEGSRCLSNGAGADAFAAAVGAVAAIPEAERSALIAARNNLAPSCTGPSNGAAGVAAAVQAATTPQGKAFAQYLQGTDAFYAGDFDAAHAGFTALVGADDPWLAETARYMIGRVELNRAQVNAFDEYGTLREDGVDTKSLDAAEAGFDDYLKSYPQGRYAASARGLLRRVYWLGRQPAKLAGTYAGVLSVAPSDTRMPDRDLADEIDNKLLGAAGPADAGDPLLLAVLDLRALRAPVDENGKTTPPPALDFTAQESALGANPALRDFLLASDAFYRAQQPEAVLKLIPEEMQTSFTPLAFSRQMLRGIALEATKDKAARDHWTAMLAGAALPFQRPAVELALALHDEQAGAIAKVFAADSPVKNGRIREILLRNVADPALLREEASAATVPQREREVALFTLLYKELTRGRYKDFLADLVLAPTDAASDGWAADISGTDTRPPLALFVTPGQTGEYDCPALKETVAQLAKNQKAAKPQLCLADFLLVNNFDQSALDEQPAAGELGSSQSGFPGAAYSRLEVYRALIEAKTTPAEDKAYALYRAVNCYAPSGNNSCGGRDVDVKQRKQWFLMLKNRYPTSRWAKELQYYW
jgi:TolA-binding protein